jgi:hypothetical protein
MNIRTEKCVWVAERGRCVGLTILPPSVSRVSWQCRILNISQPYRTLRPVTRTALLFKHNLKRQSAWHRFTEMTETLCFHLECKSQTAAASKRWPSSRSKESYRGNQWTGGWLGRRAGLTTAAKRNISCLYWESNSCPRQAPTAVTLIGLFQLLARNPYLSWWDTWESKFDSGDSCFESRHCLNYHYIQTIMAAFCIET